MHKIYIQRCLQLAARYSADTRPNPAVGALWVWSDRILGEGMHKVYGGDHAEVDAFRDIAKADHKFIKNSTLYVSLEPCFHHGKTPPCVELVLKYKPRRVVIAMKDPYPSVSGKSIRKLRREGVEVSEGFCKAEAIELNLPFLVANKLGRPFIRLKFARDRNGIIGSSDEAIWMTNSISKILVHKLRSEASAIVVGSGTIRSDNPSLTNRYWAGASPGRIILDYSDDLNTDYRAFNNDVPVWWVSGQNNAANKEETSVNPLKKVIKNKDRFLQQLLTDSLKQGINSLLVEGGKYTLESFLEAGLWDELYVFTAPMDLSAMKFKNLVSQPDYLPAEPAMKTVFLREDLLQVYRNLRTTSILQKL